MTRTLVKTSSEDEPTTDSGHDNVGIVRPPRRRTTARIHRPISRVTELRQNAADLAESDVEQDAGAEELCNLVGRDRDLLAEVYLAQLRHMRNRPADDFHATATLGVIERALTLLPRPVPPYAPPRWEPSPPRRFPWRRFRATMATTEAT